MNKWKSDVDQKHVVNLRGINLETGIDTITLKTDKNENVDNSFQNVD